LTGRLTAWVAGTDEYFQYLPPIGKTVK